MGSDSLVYLADVIIFCKTADENTARLREVFRRLRSGRHRLACRSCGSSGVGVVLPQIRQRLCECRRTFRLLEKGAEWDWSKACQSSFDAVNCAGPRISGLLSAVHHRRGRQRRPPWGGAEPKGSETRKSRGVIESHADQG
ncbi:hypothetical protein T05_10545 [Trichinella murrelli]|uniref:Uncharacterized protein n=1 Tax=Trichinella murrelli TaxID=144512 RepID=A0A0V0TVF4_9BILA|nr:hypothetical protein T05_10545 [Trichinella murrelli]